MTKNTGKLTVRNATPEDFNRCFPLLEQLYHGDIGHNFKEVFNKLATNKRSCVIMAEQNRKTLGVLIGNYYLDIDWEGKIAKTQALIVEEKHRKKGIGKKLVQHFIQKAKQNKCRAVRSRINRKNKNACYSMKNLASGKQKPTSTS